MGNCCAGIMAFANSRVSADVTVCSMQLSGSLSSVTGFSAYELCLNSHLFLWAAEAAEFTTPRTLACCFCYHSFWCLNFFVWTEALSWCHLWLVWPLPQVFSFLPLCHSVISFVECGLPACHPVTVASLSGSAVAGWWICHPTTTAAQANKSALLLINSFVQPRH